MTAAATETPTAVVRTSADDLTTCHEILRRGSKSFAAASLLLPPELRAPAAAVYSYCRLADDAIDESQDMDSALQGLYEQLDAVYSGHPGDDPVERAFSEVVQRYGIPKAVVLGLLEGFQWDASGRRYETLDDLEAYCARVASAVGVMMTLLMGPRSPEVLARACDLGLAMQLTNIARDVGEDARMGRVYLPLGLLREAGIGDPDAWAKNPGFTPALGGVVSKLLERADAYYRRADLGITMLPRRCRLAIRAARLIYADIGRVIRRRGLDSVGGRAYTSRARKAWLLLRSIPALFWRRRTCAEPARPAVKFLIDAVHDG